MPLSYIEPLLINIDVVIELVEHTVLVDVIEHKLTNYLKPPILRRYHGVHSGILILDETLFDLVPKGSCSQNPSGAGCRH